MQSGMRDNIADRIYSSFVLPFMKGAFYFLGFFDRKIKRGLEGRKELEKTLASHYKHVSSERGRIWIHASSFGELEQAKPVIEAIRASYPSSHIHLTFFSPSGYDNAIGKYLVPDLITYSPYDDRSSVEAFLDHVQPRLVLFTKYDVWPAVAEALEERDVPTILFSASLGADSGRHLPVVRSFIRRVYGRLRHILAISEEDRASFLHYGLDPARVQVGGDTRFDQVVARKDRQTATPTIPQEVVQAWEERGAFVIVAGSVWEQDVKVLAPFLGLSRSRSDNAVWIIVPHEVDGASLRSIEKRLPDSRRLSGGVRDHDRVILVDSVGQLFGLYQLADAAYVGGGFSNGVHNTLEAAVWGVPVLCGPRHRKTREVQRLIDAGGAFEVKNEREFQFALWQLMTQDDLREASGRKAQGFVEQGTGATGRVLETIGTLNVL